MRSPRPEDCAPVLFVVETLEVASGKIPLTDVPDEIMWDSLANTGFIAEIDTRFGARPVSERLAQSDSIPDLFGFLTEPISSK